MKKLCIVTTVSSSIDNWIKPFLVEYQKNEVDVTVVCNMTDEYKRDLEQQFPFVHAHPIDFPRGMSVVGSVKSIFKLTKFLKREKFDMVQYSTPNASMYAAVAAKVAKIPVRLYCQWGMVYVTRSGISRKIFETIERMVCRLSTQVQPDSVGNLEFCRQNKLYDESKSCVIWNGSAKGLDLTAYDITKKDEYAEEIRARYGIEKGEKIVGFVGRLGREKGCNELFEAFKKIKQDFPTSKLLFVGPIEKEDTIEPELLKYFYECDDIIKTNRVSDVQKHMACMDVFVLPSYREGFGMSVVEASAMGIPVVVTEYPGPSSAMVDGETGVAIPIKDAEAIYTQVVKLLSDKELSEKFAKAGRRYVEENYDQRIFMQKYIENRLELLKK
ncbi:MAG: glycosyltransferase [Acutalibacteraceae bacterium]|nr:glycosyltransferase [Acutalibacteraceae bacterium]